MIDEEVIHHVNKSSYRVKVLKSLNDEPKIPKNVAADCDILQNHISTVLAELWDLGLIVCINPDAKKGRVYRLSEEGEEIIDKLV